MEAIPGRAKRSVPGTPPPPTVTAAAAARGLGALVDVRREGVVIRMVVAGILLLLLGRLFFGVFSSLAQSSPGRLGLIVPTAIFGIVLAVLMIAGGAAFVVRGVLGGWRGHYLFEGGTVHRFATGTRVATWAEIDRFTPIRHRFGDAADGRVLGYRVEVDGRKVAAVPILLVDGRDSFIDQVVARLGAAGRPDRAATGASAPAPLPDAATTPAAVAAPASYREDTAAQREVVRARSERGVVFGVLWILLGAALTVFSYSMASGYGGGTYFLYWGAAAYGVYRIVRSLVQLKRLKD